jgi:uncharacterized membrane protein required for colicin V production
MRITIFDIVFLIALIAGAAWGFYRGVFRQARSTLVIYVALVIATVGFRGLSRMLGDTGEGASATHMLSFIILLSVTALLLTLLTNEMVNELNTDRIWVMFGGMLFGFVNMAIICATLLIVLRSATGGSPWIGYEGIQQFIQQQTRGSWMAYLFRPFMRFLLTILQPWLFGRTLPSLLWEAL